MEIHEKNLKKIISFIEEYGSVENIGIKNTAIMITAPAINGKPSIVTEVDLNRAKQYTISFTMGDIKRNLP